MRTGYVCTKEEIRVFLLLRSSLAPFLNGDYGLLKHKHQPLILLIQLWKRKCHFPLTHPLEILFWNLILCWAFHSLPISLVTVFLVTYFLVTYFHILFHSFLLPTSHLESMLTLFHKAHIIPNGGAFDLSLLSRKRRSSIPLLYETLWTHM